MKILVIGDIVGKGGRQAVCELIPKLRRQYNCCLCIANAENIAGGSGLATKCVKSIHDNGVDIVTSGDHIWSRREFVEQIKALPYVLRPANLSPCQPGKGYGIFNIPIGGQIAVINVLGRVFMNTRSDCPFAAVDRIIEEVSRRTPIIVVDIHAEATSEKIAMGRYLAGRVTAVWGTHTHVQTADERILDGGTAYITDLGMVGSSESVLGRDLKAVMHNFSTGLPARFHVVEHDIVVHGVVIEFDQQTGKALSIERIRVPWR
ncbi:MAG: TIGR00282 family metallophosphoesterase [Planctomycetota bacterium]|jgi:metallophosphoesterase (TIGR00282 family)